jgi:phytoene dehydrogenase-like protein
VSRNVVVVGGGLAGLAAALYLARAGRSVTIFEKRRDLGGRAVTQLRHGYRFNLGAHAVYRGGAASRVYRELGIPLRGGTPKSGGRAMVGDEPYKLPSSAWSLLTSSLLSIGEKLQFAKLMLTVGRMDTKPYARVSTREWLDRRFPAQRLRDVVEMYVRLATYCNSPEEQSAAATIEQLRLLRRGTLYVDEGWQKIVDALHSAAVSAGVNFITSSRVVSVTHDSRVRGIELGELQLDDRANTMNLALPDPDAEAAHGTRIPAETVLLAVDPPTACALVGDHPVTESWSACTPVRAACLDVGLSRLPEPRNTFAICMDRPYYFSVHSAWAQLTPKGGALVHVARYLRDGERAEEHELERILDELQPGWREAVVHKRWLPQMVVSNAIVRPGAPRPTPVTPIKGLYVAGDWVGGEGLLSDAALSSARSAARAILAT